MTMIPQLLLLAFFMLALGINMAKHGQPRTGNYSFGVVFVSVLIECGLLYWGGFFDVFFK